VRFSGRGNGVPAGEKPSGLPARLQETSVKARSPDFLRSPDHELQFETETEKIKWSRLPQVEARWQLALVCGRDSSSRQGKA
jgi:hypothetical protein